jgi:hypothetical protein
MTVAARIAALLHHTRPHKVPDTRFNTKQYKQCKRLNASAHSTQVRPRRAEYFKDFKSLDWRERRDLNPRPPP